MKQWKLKVNFQKIEPSGSGWTPAESEDIMKYFNLKSAIKRYNNLMFTLCYEHVTINTSFSEDTENWNIRDMVAECDYILKTYCEEGHINYEMKYSDDEEERKAWRSDTGKLKRFIEAYIPFIKDLECTTGHCSKYDN